LGVNTATHAVNAIRTSIMKEPRGTGPSYEEAYAPVTSGPRERPEPQRSSRTPATYRWAGVP
jgi:hypothetical protein